MKTEYHFHVHQRTKAVAILRLIEEHSVAVCFIGDYPQSDWPTAWEWFHASYVGTAACSEYEWWPLETREDFAWFRKLAVPDAKDVPAFVRALFAAAEQAEAARTGSPLGRAGGVQSPAPATE